MIFEVHVSLEDSYGTDINETLEIPTDLVEDRSEEDVETYIEDKVNDWFYDTTAEIFYDHWVELGVTVQLNVPPASIEAE